MPILPTSAINYSIRLYEWRAHTQQVNKQSIYHTGLAIRLHIHIGKRAMRALLQFRLLLVLFEFQPHKLWRHMQTAALQNCFFSFCRSKILCKL